MDLLRPTLKAGSQIHHRISRLEAKHPTAAFVTKCTLAAQLIMFTSMAAGELLYDANLFRGFLKRPEIWIYILIETTFASLPVCLTGFAILKSNSDLFAAKNETHFAKKAAIVWLGLGVLVIVLYKIFYWPREWRLTAVAPGLIFGWILPCSLTLFCWSLFSKTLYSSHTRAEK
jgi:hypothetical protein